MTMKKVSDFVLLMAGALLAFILFAGFLKAFSSSNDGPSPGSIFLPVLNRPNQAERISKIAATASPSISSASPPSLTSTLSAASVAASLSPSQAAVESIVKDVSILPQECHLGRRHIQDWDIERHLLLAKHPTVKKYTHNGKPRLFMLTGSQPQPCHGDKGDYLMLKSLKNKIDYCMLHDVQIFYNMAVLDKSMDSFWSKLPLIRASMEAHPEAEWFWWIDSDVVITDMLFELPLHLYKPYNLVVHGWEREVFEKKSVMGLNAGSFLVRNCGWSFKFMDRWASMGPKGRIRDIAGRLQSKLLHDRPPDYPGDDQAALIYFMIREHDQWGDKILLERRFNLNGYWLDMVGNLEGIEAGEWRKKGKGTNLLRPFVTHFAGCQPCTGNRTPPSRISNVSTKWSVPSILQTTKCYTPWGSIILTSILLM
ncbi:hypothetical protein GOP47_0023979 [Adiantum capillus-veneris]|uniref:Uncharacterized protein n=1 Tax=Adiantum capillus-veneris TaxID=13818 RepID=A0A9D4U4J9_ADICA|nr:hypothetical protein GOP47_0023979 [Adiantum capillus-veneris]